MEVVTKPAELRKKRSPIFMAAGFFDGVHKGHLKVIHSTVEAAAVNDGRSWILTFANHPLSILKPEKAPSLLTTVEQRVKLLRALGVDGSIVMPFTKRLAQRKPELFIKSLLADVPALRHIYVGRNWRFGSKGRGTPDMLRTICADAGVKVSVIDSVKKTGNVVSSTAIRAAVSKADLDAAARMLGRDYSFTGKVVRGRTVGRKLGYPTANIETGNDLLFPMGVYAVEAVVGERGRIRRKGVLNYGIRPTFAHSKAGKPVLELHLFDFSEELYGEKMEVFMRNRIRGEKKFHAPAVLVRQIEKDIEKALKIL
ncbi:riboflavin biosynthesis protein RibF [bacterium E08(2017)]|nr:riboflavin biosynthesis protein RibF [bacterium E08(2017)]